MLNFFHSITFSIIFPAILILAEHINHSPSDHYACSPPTAHHILLSTRNNPLAIDSTEAPGLHLANLTILEQEAEFLIYRFNQTERVFQKGRVVRVPRWRGWILGKGGNRDGELLGGRRMQRAVNCFGRVSMGSPGQEVEVDVDMLSGDFVVWSTSRDDGKGGKRRLIGGEAEAFASFSYFLILFSDLIF